MTRRLRHVDPHRVFLDLNTQCDFLLPRGALPVANRADVVPRIRALMDFARVTGVPVISSMDAHRPGEPGNGYVRHCIDDTPGQKKLPFTLLPRRLTLPSDNTMDLPVDVFSRYRQVILAKRSRDFLNNPKADRLVCELPVDYFVVFGVATEICVKSVVLGLIARRRAVVVVSDALGGWNSNDAELAMRQMTAKGAMFVSSERILSGEALDVPRPVLETPPDPTRPADLIRRAQPAALRPSFNAVPNVA